MALLRRQNRGSAVGGYLQRARARPPIGERAKTERQARSSESKPLRGRGGVEVVGLRLWRRARIGTREYHTTFVRPDRDPSDFWHNELCFKGEQWSIRCTRSPTNDSRDGLLRTQLVRSELETPENLAFDGILWRGGRRAWMIVFDITRQQYTDGGGGSAIVLAHACVRACPAHIPLGHLNP